MKTADQIYQLYLERKNLYGPVVAKMDELTRAYNNDLVVPLPELDKSEKAAVANFITTGVDQFSMRVSSTQPDVWFPAEKPGEPRAEKYARIRRQATLGWWKTSQLQIMGARRARHLMGYACSPVVIRPDLKAGVPRWHIRSPLATFPSQSDDPDCMTPDDCIFVYQRTYGWLRARYPQQMNSLEKGKVQQDTKFDVVEWEDDSERVLIVIGKARAAQPSWGQAAQATGAPLLELERVPNRAGRCTTIIPGRITLDRPQGRFDGMIGMYQASAKLMALELIAVTNGVFQNEWLIARPNEVPQVLVEADGKRGVTGVVQGGDIKSISENPSYMTQQTLDRLDRVQQMQGGMPPDLTGQSGTNVRTGKRGTDILSAVVDFPVQEAQTTFATSREYENQAAIAVAKGYFGDAPKSFYVNWKGAKGRVDYTPNKHFTDDTNFVTYAHAGSDINELVVGIGQRLATKIMSLKTGRRLDPLVDDPDFEETQVQAEALEMAQLNALAADVQNGKYTAVDLAKIDVFLREEKGSLSDALLAVHSQEQQRQAGPPEAPPSPDQMPGLAGGGSAVPPAQPSIGPTPDESGLASVLSALGSPVRAAKAA